MGLPENPVPELRLPPRPEDIADVDFSLLVSLAKKIVQRRLGVPAIFFLESAKPLNYVGSQAMVFFGPLVRILFESPNYYRYTELLEDRRTIELLLLMIEEFESENARRERTARAARRERRGEPRWKFWSRRRASENERERP
jgi:hypothetical protein